MVHNASTKLQTIRFVYNTLIEHLLRFAAAIVNLAPLLCAKSIGDCHLVDSCLQGGAGYRSLAKHKASDVGALLGTSTAVQEHKWFSFCSSVMHHLHQTRISTLFDAQM